MNNMPPISRRRFLNSAAAAGLGLAVGPGAASPRARIASRAALGFPDPARHWRGESSVAAAMRAGVGPANAGRYVLNAGAGPARAGRHVLNAAEAGRHVQEGGRQEPRGRTLAERFPDLRRHFVFEYYPWYAASPWRHWNEADRRPPIDIASNYMPRLGPYDSRSTATMEQHAKWINAAGAGAINVSWWGPGSDIDRLVPALMDVMAAYDIHVTFHLEPYRDDHAFTYARDIQYLITEYGERRRWDCFLLSQHADGTIGPVFKSFRTILPPHVTDCHGVRSDVPDYAPAAAWREQTDRVRETFAGDFDRLTLLADSLDVAGTKVGGFDGIAIYDNFVEPNSWAGHAVDCVAPDLVFSFNINSGYDGIVERHVDPASCYEPPEFMPGRARYDWSNAADRDQALHASDARIVESFRSTVALQTDPRLTNVGRGFFLTYINSFNEWHEGDQFEPMKDRADLSAAELAIGYHNPNNGAYRLATLSALIGEVLSG